MCVERRWRDGGRGKKNQFRRSDKNARVHSRRLIDAPEQSKLLVIKTGVGVPLKDAMDILADAGMEAALGLLRL